ncbi:MAG: prepilin peptidase, partial [Candidatus Eremiobacteraeota bacterium]|nr:prepilin peptidase [Candidatus Eremiobacteraeota bacterium]
VPPVLVLPVLLLTIAVDVHGADWAAFFTGLVILAGFGFAWMRSKGRASGLGDAELAAVAGFALGLELGTFAVALACFAAAGVSFARRERGAVAFAPYLAATITLGLFLPTHG